MGAKTKREVLPGLTISVPWESSLANIRKMLRGFGDFQSTVAFKLERHATDANARLAHEHLVKAQDEILAALRAISTDGPAISNIVVEVLGKAKD